MQKEWTQHAQCYCTFMSLPSCVLATEDWVSCQKGLKLQDWVLADDTPLCGDSEKLVRTRGGPWVKSVGNINWQDIELGYISAFYLYVCGIFKQACIWVCRRIFDSENLILEVERRHWKKDHFTHKLILAELWAELWYPAGIQCEQEQDDHTTVRYIAK